VGGVGRDGIDRRIVSFHLPDQGTGLRVPQLNDSSSTSRYHEVLPLEEGEAAYPVFVCVVDGLVQQRVRGPVQGPLLDTGVSGR